MMTNLPDGRDTLDGAPAVRSEGARDERPLSTSFTHSLAHWPVADSPVSSAQGRKANFRQSATRGSPPSMPKKTWRMQGRYRTFGITKQASVAIAASGASVFMIRHSGLIPCRYPNRAGRNRSHHRRQCLKTRDLHHFTGLRFRRERLSQAVKWEPMPVMIAVSVARSRRPAS